MEDDFIKGLEEDKKKMSAGEEGEMIDTMGQSSEKKGIQAVQEVMKEDEIKNNKRKELELEVLDKVKNQNAAYRETIIYMLHDKVAGVEFPKGWSWGVWFDGKGAVVAVRDSGGKNYKRAFRITYETKYDYQAIFKFADWVEDLVLEFKENHNPQMSIWTPNKSLN